MELQWIVGSTRRFDDEGRVATYQGDAYAEFVRPTRPEPTATSCLAAICELACLWHDVGKANADFQDKLNVAGPVKDPVRHEIASTVAFVSACRKLAGYDDVQVADAIMEAVGEIQHYDPLATFDLTPTVLPAGLRRACWLIATHHRIPGSLGGDLPVHARASWRLDDHLKDARNPVALKLDRRVVTPELCARTADLMRTIASVPDEDVERDLPWPVFLAQARLAVILADRLVSMEGLDPSVRPDPPRTVLRANGKQTLSEHLDEVSKAVRGTLSDVLDCGNGFPVLERKGLPRPFLSRSKGRFAWQNDACDRLAAFVDESDGFADRGFFAAVTAGTGSGKTRAIARTMAVLGEDVRYTLALSLRTLTLQSGAAYRGEMKLDEEEVATLVGDSAVKDLFDDGGYAPPAFGSQYVGAMSEGLESVDGDEVGHRLHGIPGFMMRHTKRDRRAERFLAAPILVSTIDQVMKCADMRRTGHVVAALRIASADLVIDEVDNFDERDLVAIGRLVFMAGAFGRRVLISSATIPQAQSDGYFDAYRAGWRSYASLYGKSADVTAAFLCDEPSANRIERVTDGTFSDVFRPSFESLATAVAERPAYRRAGVMGEWNLDMAEAVARVREEVRTLHDANATFDVERGIRFSAILVKVAHVDVCIALSRALARETPTPHAKVVCYHARYLLLARSAMERFLDEVLVRKDPATPIPKERRVAGWLSGLPEGAEACLVVVATSVEEAGRDHDFDAAIIEPTSMRSIIQSAGRVNRHRLRQVEGRNVSIMPTTFRLVRDPSTRMPFSKPGAEESEGESLVRRETRMTSRMVRDLVDEGSLSVLTARPRLEVRGHGEMPEREHDKARSHLGGDHRMALPSFWHALECLAKDHASSSRFRRHERDGREEVDVYYDPLAAECSDGFCTLSFPPPNVPVPARVIRHVSSRTPPAAFDLLDLEPASLLAGRVGHDAHESRIRSEARKFLKMTLACRDGADPMRYVPWLGAEE